MLCTLGRYLARGLAGEVDLVRAWEALTRARAGGVTEAETAALPSEALEDETGPAVPEMPVTLELADLESAPAPELEIAAEALLQPVSGALSPYLSFGATLG